MTRAKKRWWLGGLAMVCLLWLGFVGFIGWAMRQPPEVFGRVMSRMPTPAYFLFPFETMWTQARRGTLHAGDAGPGMTVQALESKQPVVLSELWENRPVVLIFGSYT